jgi:O-antigen/teichoic acid export membrane protein
MSVQAERVLSVNLGGASRTLAGEADLTGHRRLAWNVMASWGGQGVVAVCGFIMPRLIDRHVGQVSLGIWDFCWSVVTYFGLTGVGIGSSVNRHVALYRASNQPEKLRTAVSSVNAIQILVSCLIAVMAVLLSWSFPNLFSQRLGSHIVEAQAVVILLGGSLAVQMAFDCYRGVMTGCHRWDLHNAINAGSYGLTVLGMIAVLSLGGNLRGVGATYLLATVTTELVRVALARRVCPELSVNPRYATLDEARRMLVFGAKASVASVTPLVVQQTAAIIVGACLGPAALAVFARPSNLIRNAQAFLNKFAFVLTPVASSLQGTGRSEELQTVFLTSSRFGAAMTVPMMLTLAIYSDLILRVWMGSRYQGGAIVMVILAAGYTMPLAQQSSLSILIGINRHGRTGVLTLLVAVLIAAAGFGLFQWVGWSLAHAALFAGTPITIAAGFVLPVYACKQLNVKVRKYLTYTWLSCSLCAIPYAGALLLARHFLGPLALFVGPVLGAAVIAPLYWPFVLTEEIRARVLNKLRQTEQLRVDSCAHKESVSKSDGCSC